MHHIVVERWSRLDSLLHKLDARAKVIALFVFLIAISTTPPEAQTSMLCFALLLAVVAVLSRLPVVALLRRALLVLPFTATFAAMTWFSGDPGRALALAEKSFLSGFAALLLIGTTPLPQLAGGLEKLGVPRTLLLVIQFLYRYLFVISEQAQHMRLAAQSRQGLNRARRSRFQAAAGALGVLFERSSKRADGIYQAMLARGFDGRFPTAVPKALAARDILFLTAAAALCLTIRVIAWVE
jgi:cobalt/nickel transport system permease protein